MPTYEYRCARGHVVEEFFKTISEGSKYNTSLCLLCFKNNNDIVSAFKIPSVPLPAHLYGNPAGYSRPSPTKRFSTKTASREQGNSDSNG